MVFPCDLCPQEFATSSDLARHKNRKIPCNAGKFECTGCDHKFTTKKAMKAHVTSGCCKGKRPAARVQQLEQEVEHLQQQLEEQEVMANMTNAATAAAAQHIGINNGHVHQTNVTINVNALNPTRSLGDEDLSHLSGLSVTELLGKLNLRHGPQAIADWCALVRADEEHPHNHNALLLKKDSEQMACCRGGKWIMDERKKVLLELLNHDVVKMYNQLSKLDEDPKARIFRMEYLLHHLMTTSAAGDLSTLQPVMDAMAEPIVELTNKLYVETVPEQPKSSEYLALKSNIDALVQNNALTTACSQQLQERIAAQNAIILSMRRDLAAMAHATSAAS